MKNASAGKLLLGGLLYASCSVSGALGQGFFAPPPSEFFGVPPIWRTTGTNAPGEAPPIIDRGPQNEPPLQFGPIGLRPHLLYRFSYATGVPGPGGETLDTVIHDILPGILIDLGQHWRLDYTPTLRYYETSELRDTTDHAVALTGGTVYRDWTLGFSQHYASASDPLIETGVQTSRRNYTTAIDADYRLSSALSLELGANQDFRFVQGDNTSQFADVMSWSTHDWLNYQFSERLGAAVGLGLGFDQVNPGANMIWEQLQGRVTWRPGEKLTLAASVGVEDRQFLDSDASNAINPLFGLSALYALFEQTTLSVGASRTIAPSYFQSELSEGNSVQANLRQRLLGKLFFEVGGGYQAAKYTTTSGTAAGPDREDHGPFFHTRLDLELLKRGRVSVFYQRTENHSNQSTFDAESSQVGCEVGYRF